MSRRAPTETQRALGQYMTPDWAAEALVAEFFGDLTLCDRVIEPSCGRGAFLRAVPGYVPTVGIEIDPELAAFAQAHSGREVVVGDFRTCDLPFTPTAILGNPPFALATIEGFMARAWALLPDAGRVGFILPCSTFQTANTVDRFAQRWHVQQDFIPRDLFPGLSYPLCFARFTKGKRGLVGFALYHERVAVNRLQARYRALLAQGERSVWAAVTRAALEALGGRATLAELYAEIAGHRPTGNRFWQEKVRQQVQRIGYRVGPGQWAVMPEAIAA